MQKVPLKDEMCDTNCRDWSRKKTGG
jgi:hypothetical protein